MDRQAKVNQGPSVMKEDRRVEAMCTGCHCVWIKKLATVAERVQISRVTKELEFKGLRRIKSIQNI